MTEIQTIAPTESGAPPTRLRVEGMTCNNCARQVTEASQSVSGVQSATVSLAGNSAVIRWDSPAVKDVPAVIAAITAAGYEAQEIVAKPGAASRSESPLARWQFNLWLGVGVTALLMLGEWGFRLMPVPWFRWLSFALAAVVQVWCGMQFYRGAWRQLKAGSSNMDTLVALGSTTAFGFSCWVLFTGTPADHLFFMEAAAIISLISLGHWVEAQVSDRASGALQALLTLAPATARRLQTAKSAEPGIEVETPVADLRPGDLIVLKPGDRIPTDGVVTQGESAVDEAMLTGESVPVDKQAGGELYAGTVNQNGRLIMRVTGTGEATALARVIAAVQRAQTSRADIQRLGDRVSNVFVPIIVAVAIAAALWWGLAFNSALRFHAWLAPWLWHAHPPASALAAAFIVAAAVLIVACPCAMGLATPAAIMAAANAAARLGILVRDGVALEKAGRITAVLFDKTGTLTVGKPDQALFLASPLSTEPDQTAIPLAVALARNSTHPISRAIAHGTGIAMEAALPELNDWREIRGSGVQATLNTGPTGNLIVRLGSLDWLAKSGVELGTGTPSLAQQHAQSAIVVGLARGSTFCGLFVISDPIKTGAAGVIGQLHRQGLKTYLVTGDHPITAAALARQAGIPAENVFAGVRPEQKAELVKRLQSQGERIAFIGDGINDAPALTQADLGIAVSRASDVAREAADIILLKSEIEAVPEALGLARATLRTIRQNLFWAFFYNALAIPLAATGFVSPVLCAAAMGFSDLIVIGNALRLLRFRSVKR